MKTKNKKSAGEKTYPIAHRVMKVSEVNKCTEIIRSCSRKTQEVLLDLHLGKGWEVLNYINFKEYVEGELPTEKYATLLNHAKTAVIVNQLAGREWVGEFSCNSIIPLRGLGDQRCKVVWRELVKQSGKTVPPPKWLTRAVTEAAILKCYPNTDDDELVVDVEPEPIKKAKQKKKRDKFKLLINKIDENARFAKEVLEIYLKVYGFSVGQKALDFMEKRLDEMEDDLNN